MRGSTLKRILVEQDVSVSELARWVESQAGVAVSPGADGAAS